MAAPGWQFLQSARKDVPRQKHKREGELATEQVQRVEMFSVQFDLQKAISAEFAHVRSLVQRYQNRESKLRMSAMRTRIPEAKRTGESRVPARTIGAA